jgi:hypothetical protein
MLNKVLEVEASECLVLFAKEPLIDVVLSIHIELVHDSIVLIQL